MKCFQLLVQERKAEIPAPVSEVVARAAAAPPPLPPCLSMVLHGKFYTESSWFAPKVPSETSSPAICLHSKRQKQNHAPQRTQPSILQVFVGPAWLHI